MKTVSLCRMDLFHCSNVPMFYIYIFYAYQTFYEGRHIRTLCIFVFICDPSGVQRSPTLKSDKF